MVGAALLVRLIQPTAARMGRLMLMTLSALVLCQVRRQPAMGLLYSFLPTLMHVGLALM
jgi:hypothetical protein